MTANWDPLRAIRIRPAGGAWRSPLEPLRCPDQSYECVDVAVHWESIRPAVSWADELRQLIPILRRVLADTREVVEFAVHALCPQLWLGVLDILATIGYQPQRVVFRIGPYDVPELYHPPGSGPEAGTPLTFPSVDTVHAATCLDATDPSFLHLLNYFPTARIWYDEIYAYAASDLAVLACSGRVNARVLIFDPSAGPNECDVLAGMLDGSNSPEGPSSSMRAFLANITNVQWVIDSTKPSDALVSTAASVGAAGRALAAFLSPLCHFTVQFSWVPDLEYISALSSCITDLVILDSVPDAMYRKRSALRVPIEVLRCMPKIERICFINSASHAADAQELRRRLAWAGDTSVTIGGIEVRVPSGPDKTDFMMRLHGALDFSGDVAGHARTPAS